MKNKTIAFLLTLVGCVGVAGLQYLYMGKYMKALLWFFTLGMCWVGTIIDLFTITSQVEQHNINKQLETIRAKAMK